MNIPTVSVGVFLIISLCALIGGLLMGAHFEKREYKSGVIAMLVFALSFGTVFVYALKHITEATIYEPDKEAYVISKKVLDGSGAFLILHDEENWRKRVAYFSTYPPPGYEEKVSEDGRQVLVLSGKRIIVGGPDEVVFIHSIVPDKARQNVPDSIKRE